MQKPPTAPVAAYDPELSRRQLQNADSLPQGGVHWYDTLRAAISHDSMNAAAFREMSVFYTKSGDYENARIWLDKAVQKDPYELGYRGWLNLYKMRSYDKAIDDLMEFSRVTKSKYAWGESVALLIGLAYKQKKDYAQALRYINDYVDGVTKSDGEAWVDVYAFVYRGICKRNIEDYQGAVKDFGKAIQYANGGCPEAYYQRALVLLESNPEQACDDLKKASDLATRGYIRSDPYKEFFDQLYIEEILETMAAIHCS